MLFWLSDDAEIEHYTKISTDRTGGTIILKAQYRGSHSGYPPYAGRSGARVSAGRGCPRAKAAGSGLPEFRRPAEGGVRAGERREQKASEGQWRSPGKGNSNRNYFLRNALSISWVRGYGMAEPIG